MFFSDLVAYCCRKTPERPGKPQTSVIQVIEFNVKCLTQHWRVHYLPKVITGFESKGDNVLIILDNEGPYPVSKV